MKRLFPWLLVIIIAFLWLWRISDFPGLHADEAWAGLRAHGFLTTGHLEAFGMTRYTGSMQSLLAAPFFEILGTSVFSLRIAGILFNLAGLCLVVKVLGKGKKQASCIFLLLMLQSSMWLLYPRIAWEVSSFTLFFVAIFLFIHSKINTQKSPETIWVFLFFLVGLLSSYNHIIFSCIAFAYLLARIVMALIKGEFSLKRLYVPVMNMVNISILFSCMKILKRVLFEKYVLIIFAVLIFLAFIESFFISRIQDRIGLLATYTVKQRVNILLIVYTLALVPFFYFHGWAVLNSMTSYKTFQHILGMPSDNIHFLFSMASTILSLACFLFLLSTDLKAGKISFSVAFILSYMALFSFYTQANSPRYYLALQLFIFLYLAFNVKKLKMLWMYLILIAIGGCWNLFLLADVYRNKQTTFVARDMYFGSRYETSNHFKSIVPLMDSLRKYRVKHINYADNHYFLEQPIRFMELIRPWDKEEGTSITIDYGDTEKNGGFIWINRTEN